MAGVSPCSGFWLMPGRRALRPGALFEGKYLCTRFTELFLEYDAEPSGPVSDGGISALSVKNQAYGLDHLLLRVTQVSCNGQGLGQQVNKAGFHEVELQLLRCERPALDREGVRLVIEIRADTDFVPQDLIQGGQSPSMPGSLVTRPRASIRWTALPVVEGGSPVRERISL